MAPVLLSLVILSALAPSILADDYCEAEEQDPKVYLFGYGYSFTPYEYLNDDAELMGLGYDITRSVCRAMKKKCEHAVYYDYSLAMNNNAISEALNDEWYDALVSWLPTPQRESAYAFFGEYAYEPSAYMYVRLGSHTNTLDKVKEQALSFGFRSGFRTDVKCLEKYLGISLASKSTYYNNVLQMQDDLNDGDLDVIFVDESDARMMFSVSRVGDEPIRCSSGGISSMTRKDKMHTLTWYDEGLQKLKDSGDYSWLCEMNYVESDPGCLEN